MALGLAEGGRQQAPLGRAVIGGLIGSLLAVTLVMPKVFVLIRSPAKRNSQSLDPTDPNSPYYDPDVDRLASESGFPMKNAITTGSLLFLHLIFTSSGTLAQEPANASVTLPKVSVVKAKAALIEHKIEQPGQVEPSMSAEIQSRASGWIKSVLVDIGDFVRKGQPLIEIDAPELQAELATSQAKVDEALAQVELAKRQYEEIVETLKANDARLQASTQDLKGKQAIERQFKMEMDRIKKLVDSGAVTRSNLEEAEQKYLAAGAELSESAAMELAARAENDSARAQLARRQAEITVAESRLALSRGQARETQARHGFTTIRAPFDGVVVERNTDPGQLVSSNGPARQPLLLLHHLEKLTVTVGVPESEAPLVDVGDSVEIFTSQNAAKPAYTGKISRTSRAYNPATRTLRAEIDLPASQSPLNDGQYVLVRVIGHRVNEAVSLPLNSLYKVAGSSFCTVVENGKARRVPVTAGVGDGIRVAISAGLKVGDTVVVGPVAATLADGQAVDATELDEAKK
jgi:RND family efflux transporter MFP subunit